MSTSMCWIFRHSAGMSSNDTERDIVRDAGQFVMNKY